MTRYVALAERDETGVWTGTVAGLPGAITQAGRLSELRGMAAEAVEALTGVPVAAEDVDVTVVLGSVEAAAAELRQAS